MKGGKDFKAGWYWVRPIKDSGYREINYVKYEDGKYKAGNFPGGVFEYRFDLEKNQIDERYQR